MFDFLESPLQTEQLDRLSFCGTCGRIHGEVVLQLLGKLSPPRRQCCDCEPPGATSHWPGYDLPEAVSLCRCCGRRPVLSGTTWAIWFCDACRRAVERINRLGRCHVIPIGRHTLLDQIGRDEDGVDQEIPPFVTALGDWFARVERLEMHAWLVMQSNFRELARGAQAECTLVDYLERLPATAEFIRAAVRDLGRAFELPPDVIVEATADIE